MAAGPCRIEADLSQDVAAMLHNPNNVGTEGSALTSQLEKEVGEGLCRMLGYYKNRDVTPWGHLTCVSCGGPPCLVFY